MTGKYPSVRKTLPTPNWFERFSKKILKMIFTQYFIKKIQIKNRITAYNIRNSIRRFFCRFSSVSLGRVGCVCP